MVYVGVKPHVSTALLIGQFQNKIVMSNHMRGDAPPPPKTAMKHRKRNYPAVPKDASSLVFKFSNCYHMSKFQDFLRVCVPLSSLRLVNKCIMINLLFYLFIYPKVGLDCKLGACVQNCLCLSVCQECVGADVYVSGCVNCTTCS